LFLWWGTAAAAHAARLDVLLALCVADEGGGGVLALRVQWGAAQVRCTRMASKGYPWQCCADTIIC
jgi:hypothetical protein